MLTKRQRERLKRKNVKAENKRNRQNYTAMSINTYGMKIHYTIIPKEPRDMIVMY